MDKNSESSKSSDSRHPTARQGLIRGFVDRFWDYFWEKFGLQSIGAELKNHATAHPAGVKSGRILATFTVVMILVFAAGFSLSSCRRNEAAETEQRAAESARDRATMQSDLANKYRVERDDAVRKYEHVQVERDRVNNTLKRAEQSANIQVQTNLPPDVRFDTILRQLKSLGWEAYDFAFMVNGADVTNETWVVLTDEQEIVIEVRNLGEIAAKDLTIHFSPFLLGTTNVANAGWSLRGSQALMMTTNPIGSGPVYDTVSQSLIPPGGRFGGAPLRITTNYSSPFLRAKLGAFAERTKEHVCYVNFVIAPNVAK